MVQGSTMYQRVIIMYAAEKPEENYDLMAVPLISKKFLTIYKRGIL
jgi:hypothetical protein